MSTSTSARPRTPRLRRSDCSGPGLTRRRSGRGFTYLTSAGERCADDATIARIRDLAIPPAWEDVWICADAQGHLQAVGTDAAGRRQYLYHPRWRELRDRHKFEQMLTFGQRLPYLRRQVSADIATDGLTRERVLAAAARLLDLGLFRIGGSHDQRDDDTGLGLSTVRFEHVTVETDAVTFDYVGKAGIRRVLSITDPQSVAVITALRRRRSGPEELLAFREGRHWRPLPAEAINDYLKATLGDGFSAKDFRTWNGTVLAAVSIAAHAGDARSAAARRRLARLVSTDVSELLGNTPAVARRSYIDPRVFDRFDSGWILKLPAALAAGLGDTAPALTERTRRDLELGVLELLRNDHGSRTTRVR